MSLKAACLERRMVELFGPDFREKTVVSATGVFRLADVFDECGLEDPRRLWESRARGLPQWELRSPPAAPTVSSQVEAAARYIKTRYGGSW